jgi:uncharacterized protein (TIGR03435 family)
MTVLSGAAGVRLVIRATVLVAVGLGGAAALGKARASVRHGWMAASFVALAILPLANAVWPDVGVSAGTAAGMSCFRPLTPEALAFAAATPSDGATIERGEQGTGPWAVWLRDVWAAGAVCLLLPLLVEGRRRRRLHRESAPWPAGLAVARAVAMAAGVDRPMDVRRHPFVTSPMTWGHVHPVILLPVSASAWPADNLRWALAHELEHVRRHDWTLHVLARLVCSLYWFHPLVWIACRRLALEAERACDDEVLRRADPVAYASQLVALARGLREPGYAVALPMAGQSDLSMRVNAILSRTTRRGRLGRSARAVIVATVALALLTVVVVDRAAASPSFDDVVLTRSAPRDATSAPSMGTQAGGMCGAWGLIPSTDTCVSARGWTVAELALLACSPTGLVPPVPPIVGPTWMQIDRYDAVARAAGTHPLEILDQSAIATRMHTLLADRFRLQIHHEIRPLPVWELHAIGDAHLLPPARDCDGACMLESGAGYIKSEGTRMPRLATILSNHLRAVVLDRTGVRSAFRVDLVWRPEGDSAGVSIDAALRSQLGLKLTRAIGPVDTLVVDRVERPTRTP